MNSAIRKAPATVSSSINAIVAEANLAPTVHNTQPARWRTDGAALVLRLDPSRVLAVADPERRDARLSLGSALYGTRVAAARSGYSVRGVDIGDSEIRLELCDKMSETWDNSLVSRRMTWRGGFAQTPRSDLSRLRERSDTTLTHDQVIIEALAELNDNVSLSVMRRRAFRDELRHWMRLSDRHPNWSRDGMNSRALCLSSFESVAAKMVLRSPVFEIFDKLGMSGLIAAESAKTRSAHWIAAFHRPEGEDPVHSGEAFYEMWLTLTACGQAAWPMAALADDSDARREASRLVKLPGGRRLINVLRVGPLPEKMMVKARIPAVELIDD